MDDTFVCRCGMTVSRHNITLDLARHVQSPEHEAGLRDKGITQHNHSERLVTEAGVPVETGTPGARPYRTTRCPACVAAATKEAEFIHDSELPAELCPYVDCDDHSLDYQPDTVLLTMANRLYVADLKIARDTLARTQADLAKVQRRVNEAFDRVKELESVGLAPYIATIEEARETA